MLNSSDKKERLNFDCRGFTLVEVVAALALLTIMLSSVLVVMDHFVGAVIDMRLRQAAFDQARSNMETLLSESKVSDTYDYGESETNPDVRWETIVEPFYEPYKNRMWIRAICSASFIDSRDEEQTVELEHWITNLTAAQIKKILAQQKIENAYMELLNEGEYSEIQMATIAYLEQEGLDAEAYKDFLEQQRRKKAEYLDEKGMDRWDEFLEGLQEDENKFLEDIGMNFDDYNDFAATYVPPATDDQFDIDEIEDQIDQLEEDPDSPEDPSLELKEKETKESVGSQFDWPSIPKELWPLIQKLTGEKPPSQ